MFRGWKFFYSCVRHRRAEASLSSSSWRCGLVEVPSFDFGQCIYHTIPYVVDVFTMLHGIYFRALGREGETRRMRCEMTPGA